MNPNYTNSTPEQSRMAGEPAVAMATATLNPTQMHLLKLFSFNRSEDYAREVQHVLTQHFQQQLDAEADRLWNEGILNQERLDAMRHEDLHKRRQWTGICALGKS